jgi:hypothetical protein
MSWSGKQLMLGIILVEQYCYLGNLFHQTDMRYERKLSYVIIKTFIWRYSVFP